MSTSFAVTRPPRIEASICSPTDGAWRLLVVLLKETIPSGTSRPRDVRNTQLHFVRFRFVHFRSGRGQ